MEILSLHLISSVTSMFANVFLASSSGFFFFFDLKSYCLVYWDTGGTD